MSTGRQPTQFQKAPARQGGMKYEDMARTQKIIFITKVVICVCTFGFAFPTVQSD
jgi:hypothetical protein